jgi:hypothetical protein
MDIGLIQSIVKRMTPQATDAQIEYATQQARRGEGKVRGFSDDMIELVKNISNEEKQDELFNKIIPSLPEFKDDPELREAKEEKSNFIAICSKKYGGHRNECSTEYRILEGKIKMLEMKQIRENYGRLLNNYYITLAQYLVQCRDFETNDDGLIPPDYDRHKSELELKMKEYQDKDCHKNIVMRGVGCRGIISEKERLENILGLSGFKKLWNDFVGEYTPKDEEGNQINLKELKEIYENIQLFSPLVLKEEKLPEEDDEYFGRRKGLISRVSQQCHKSDRLANLTMVIESRYELNKFIKSLGSFGNLLYLTLESGLFEFVETIVMGQGGGGKKRKSRKRKSRKRKSRKKNKTRKKKKRSKKRSKGKFRDQRGGGMWRWFQIFFISLVVIVIIGLCIADVTGTSLASLLTAVKATTVAASQSAHIAAHTAAYSTAAGHSTIASAVATANAAQLASSAASGVAAGHILNTVAIAAAVASFGEVLFKQIDKKQRRINVMVAEREQILGAERRVADIERPLRERDIKVAKLEETVQKLRMELNTLKTGAPIEIKPAEDFICPISQYIMEDPVTIGPEGSRQTYDKLYIEQHFASGKKTDPLTNQELKKTEMQLVPNDTLKTRIDVFKQKSKGTLLNAISQRDVGNIKESEELLKAVITMGIDEDSEEAQKILDEISGLQLQLEPAPAPALEEEEEEIRTKVRHERMGMSSRVAADRTGSRVPLRPQPPDPWSKESLKAKGFGASATRLKDKKDKTPQEQITYDVIIGRITKIEAVRRAAKLDEELLLLDREEERSKRMSERQQLLTPGSDGSGRYGPGGSEGNQFTR